MVNLGAGRRAFRHLFSARPCSVFGRRGTWRELFDALLRWFYRLRYFTISSLLFDFAVRALTIFPCIRFFFSYLLVFFFRSFFSHSWLYWRAKEKSSRVDTAATSAIHFELQVVLLLLTSATKRLKSWKDPNRQLRDPQTVYCKSANWLFLFLVFSVCHIYCPVDSQLHPKSHSRFRSALLDIYWQ